MDAHLFRRFCDLLLPLLTGARLEKLQEPAPGILTLTFYGSGRKRQLCLRFGRKEPFCFLTESRISTGHAPTAQLMRLRKYALKCSTVQVTIRDPNFRDICRQKRLGSPSYVSRDISRAVMARTMVGILPAQRQTP